MDKPSSRYDVTIRVAKQDCHQPDRLRSRLSPARVVSLHTAQEIIGLVSVAALNRPSAVAVALAVVADALKAEGRVRSPSR